MLWPAWMIEAKAGCPHGCGQPAFFLSPHPQNFLPITLSAVAIALSSDLMAEGRNPADG